MQNIDRARFKIRFEHAKVNKLSSSKIFKERRFGFWRPFIIGSEVAEFLGSFDDPKIGEFESELLGGKFADELAKKIHQSAGKRSGDGIDSKATDIDAARARLPLADFSISVVGRIHYGSLELTMLLEGARKVADAFDNNFEWFESLLESFAPEAWSAVISPSVDGLKCTLIEMEALESVFGGSGAQSNTPQENQSPTQDRSTTLQDDPTPAQHRSTRVQWLWVVSNTSLIIPFVLALAVLYFSSQHMEHIQSVALKLYADNRSTDAALIKVYENREAELLKTLVESFKAVNSKVVEPCCCNPSRKGVTSAPSSAPKEPASCGSTK